MAYDKEYFPWAESCCQKTAMVTFVWIFKSFYQSLLHKMSPNERCGKENFFLKTFSSFSHFSPTFLWESFLSFHQHFSPTRVWQRKWKPFLQSRGGDRMWAAWPFQESHFWTRFANKYRVFLVPPKKFWVWDKIVISQSHQKSVRIDLSAGTYNLLTNT